MATTGPAAPILVRQGIREHQLGRLDSAAELYGQAIDLDPTEPDALNLLGTLRLQQGTIEQAVPLSIKAVLSDPRSFTAYNNLGLILKHAGHNGAAALCYRKALAIHQDFADAHSNLGVVLKAEGQTLAAIDHYKKAVDLQPDLGEAYNNLANAYQEIGELPEAVEAYMSAAEHMPDSDTIHYNVGMLLDRQGHSAKALYHLRRSLELNPGRSDAKHMVAALEGTTTDNAPPDYVRALFDDYAPRFEAHLVGDLQYRTHRDLIALIDVHRRARRFEHAVDLGCGTGLMGQGIRTFVDDLQGVDLSARMLRQAERKELYDRLVEADIRTFLASMDQTADLIVASDVFVYFGALDDTVEQIGRACAPGGFFAFSVEAEPPEARWVLRPSGRYGHGDGYITEILHANGFSIIERLRTTLRQDRGKPILGIAYLAVKARTD